VATVCRPPTARHGLRDFLPECFDVADIAAGFRSSRRTRLGIFSISFSIASALSLSAKAGGDALARSTWESRCAWCRTAAGRKRCCPRYRRDDEGEMQRRPARCRPPAADAAFEFGDALFEHGGGRVRDPAVAIAFGLEVEQSGAVIGAVEGVGHRLVDRNRNRLGRSDRGRSRRELRWFRCALSTSTSAYRISTCVLFAASFVKGGPSTLQ